MSARFRSCKAYVGDEQGATAVEFSIVALIVILMFLGIMDLARFAWELNSQKAAARAGARYAAVHPPVADALLNVDGMACGLNGGSLISNGLVADIRCTSSLCSVTKAGSCVNPASKAPNGNFSKVVGYMQGYDPRISASNVVIEYKERGMGVAGNPYGTDVSPLITVSVTGAPFQPIALRMFGVTFNMPSVATTMTAEDLS